MADILGAAHQKLRRCEWLGAADLCHRALAELDPSLSPDQAATVNELLGKCQYESAFQSANRQEFKQKMQVSREFYEKAKALYSKARLDAASKKSDAQSLFTSFWIEEDPERRRGIVERCISLASDAVHILDETGNKVELAETHNDILRYLRELIHLATDWMPLYESFDRTIQLGRRAINEFGGIGDDAGLVDALHQVLWALAVESELILEIAKFEQLTEETVQLGKKLTDTTQKIGTPYALCLANEAAGDIAWDIEGDLSKAFNLYQKAASFAKETKHSFTIGRLFAIMSILQRWQAKMEEYAEGRREAIGKGVRLGEQGIESLRVSSHTSYLAKAYSSCAGCYIDLAELVETDREKKRAHLATAVELATKGTTCETRTVSWRESAHELSKAMYFLAINEGNPAERRRLLYETLPIREETVRVTDILQPHSWNRGVMRNYLALIKAELAKLEPEASTRRKLLEESASNMEQCMDLCRKWLSIPGSAQSLARYSEWHGDITFQLYGLDHEPDTAHRAIAAYQEADSYLRKSRHSSLGSLSWKIARVYDSLRDFKGASGAFGKAAEDYMLEAGKIPGLGPVYRDLASYMDAWVKIENARLYHTEEEYSLAAVNYKDAAKTLLTTSGWKYLSRLCAARSLLEEGEALSSDERYATSIEVFRKAATTFAEAVKELEQRMESPAAQAEPEMSGWLESASQRESYCRGRIELEDAKALDRKGKRIASSRKFRSASESFKSLASKIVSAQDRTELETLALFCEAWAQMKEAESKVDPKLYSDAAESFLKVRETTTREKFRLLALADAAICKALEAGTKFRLTRNTTHYSEIKKQLETAADYYQEAGFKKTASWTRATQRLFDALAYMVDAEVERDRARKTELYHLAEKHLELAARLYDNAGFPTKKQEALEHLQRAREEKRILLSPIESALTEIPIASGSSITSIIPGRSQPLGLERFEEANVVGNLSVPEREIIVGSDFTYELEMANVGRATATLVKLENIVPEGFEIERERNPYRIEDSSINMRGKRLEHLKMDELKIVLKPVRRGTFQLRPTISFTDEKGNYRNHELQPVGLTVGELGITGWLRGAGKKKDDKIPEPREPQPSETRFVLPPGGILPPVRIPEGLRFETERARDVFQHLVKNFVEDYMSRRLYMEKAGWRSLMEVIRESKIPRSALYGPQRRDGPVLAELERRGLIETRIFPEEPGRGGEITKIRVAYDNTIVRRIVEQAVMRGS